MSAALVLPPLIAIRWFQSGLARLDLDDARALLALELRAHGRRAQGGVPTPGSRRSGGGANRFADPAWTLET